MAKLSCFVLLVSVAITASANVYIIGDSAGWKSVVDYNARARIRSFTIGKSLVFNYVSGDTVAEASQKDYQTYSLDTASNPISVGSTGSTTFSLDRAGIHFFISGVPYHCTSSMKIPITVSGLSNSTLPSISAPPSLPMQPIPQTPPPLFPLFPYPMPPTSTRLHLTCTNADECDSDAADLSPSMALVIVASVSVSFVLVG